MATPQEPKPGNDYSQTKEQFSDVFETHINPWSAVVTFGLRATKPEEDNRFTTRIRMPLQLAKALAVMLLRSIRGYEQQTETDIDLPKEVLESLGIGAKDWERFSET